MCHSPAGTPRVPILRHTPPWHSSPGEVRERPIPYAPGSRTRAASARFPRRRTLSSAGGASRGAWLDTAPFRLQGSGGKHPVRSRRCNPPGLARTGTCTGSRMTTSSPSARFPRRRTLSTAGGAFRGAWLEPRDRGSHWTPPDGHSLGGPDWTPTLLSWSVAVAMVSWQCQGLL